MGPVETRGCQAAEGMVSRREQSSFGFLRSSPQVRVPSGSGVRTVEIPRPRGRVRSGAGMPPGNLERGTRMRGLLQSVSKFVQAEDGPTAVEYAVMLALIIVVCITAITALGSNANKTFTSVGTTIGSTGS